jgi:hypothetical protein
LKRSTIFAIAALLLAATAMSALTAAITDTKDSGPGSSTFTRDCSGIASTSRTDLRSDSNQNAYAARSPYPATGSPTSRPGPCIGEYVINQIEDSCVPGETDIGNHGDNTVTTVALPFPYTLYDHTFNSINLSSNGNAQFTTTDGTETNICLPWLTHNSTIFPYWEDQRTDANLGCSAYPGGTCGIYTSVSGIAPNRILNIEWRAVYNNNTSQHANHELRLYEGQSRFDVIYCTVDQGNSSATAGVQRDNTFVTQYFCDGSGGGATGGQSYLYIPRPCPTQPPLTPRPRPTPAPRP